MKNWKAWLGLAISAAAIWWAARGVAWDAVGAALAGADYRFLLIIVLLAPAVGIGMRAVRWQLLLRPSVRVPFSACFSATAVGLMVNNILPARIGEFVRAYGLAKRERIPMGTTFGALVVERLFDGFALVGWLYLVTWLRPFPEWVTTTARVGFLIFAGFLAFDLALVWWPRPFLGGARGLMRRIFGGRFEAPVVHVLESFIAGFQILRRPLLSAASLALAFVQWGLTALSFLIAMAAFDFATRVGWTGALFLNTMTALGVAVPSSPGFVGTFQAAVVKSLVVLGIDRTLAFSYSVAYHAVNYLSVTAVGVWFFLRAGLSWNELGASKAAVEASVDSPGVVPR